MPKNSLGTLFTLTSFGESHGPAIGGVIDGCPSGIHLDMEAIEKEMARRRPGQSAIVTQRKEADQVEFLSGIFEGKTTGAPIGFIIRNQDQKSGDYEQWRDAFRPSHADYTYQQKYGIRDHRGGGRSSARETAARVVAGSVARQALSGVTIQAFVSAVGEISLDKSYPELDLSLTESNDVRCPDPQTAERMEALIREVRKDGDTVGGVVSCVIKGVPAGWGEPVFDKLHAQLGKAMLSINAVKGFEIGSGFGSARLRGSVHNDLFNPDGTTQTNHSGGIQGGISNGMDIYFRVAFKPVATLIQPQEVLSATGDIIEMQGRGRHDPCVVPRAVPIVEAMAAMVLLDFKLLQNSTSHAE